jgi:hypothetical protein
MTEGTSATEAAAALLDRVRKLLAKAEGDGVPAPEAEALTAKAAELMAKYGIDRALLAKAKPETDKPGDRKIDIDNPWARVQAHLLAGLASAMRCQCVILPRREAGSRIHLFGFQSDLERTDVLYTSLLLQMFTGLEQARPPSWVRSPRAWRRSWLLGFISAAVARVRAAEAGALKDATQGEAAGGGASLVLADRRTVITQNLAHAYPVTRKTQMTYSGNGYGAGQSAGQRADIGQPAAGHGRQGQLTGS